MIEIINYHLIFRNNIIKEELLRQFFESDLYTLQEVLNLFIIIKIIRDSIEIIINKINYLI